MDSENDSLPWDTTQGCVAVAEICPQIISDSLWAINPMIINSPNCQPYNVNDVLGGGDIQSDFLPVFPCIDIIGLCNENPEGTWEICATNVGTDVINVTIPAFQLVLDADSCSLIEQSRMHNIGAVQVSIEPGDTQCIQYNFPPPATGFDPNCIGFGEPVELYFKNCCPPIVLTASVDSVSTYGGSDGSIVLDVQSATAGFTYAWSNGMTEQNVSGLSTGEYTVEVTNACGSSQSLTVTVPGPPLGVDENTENEFHLFQNVPNPFAGKTTFDFISPSAARYQLAIRAMDGSVVLLREIRAVRGRNSFILNVQNLAAGVYVYSVGNEKYLGLGKLVVVEQQ